MSPNAGGGGELRDLSQWVQLYTGAQINFGDLTPYLTYAENYLDAESESKCRTWYRIGKRCPLPTSCVPELKLEIPVCHVESPAVVVQAHRALPVRRLSERVVHESPAQNRSLTDRSLFHVSLKGTWPARLHRAESSEYNNN